MTSALLVVVVFLTVLTLGNILLLFAVIRRLRHLQDLVVPAPLVPAVGTVVEPFHLEAVDGARLTESDLAAGPVLVAVLSTTCPACGALADDLASMSRPSSCPIVLVVADPDHDSSALLQAVAGMDRVAVIDRTHPVLAALGGITAFPTVLVVGDGAVVSSGTRLDQVLPALHERRRLTMR